MNGWMDGIKSMMSLTITILEFHNKQLSGSDWFIPAAEAHADWQLTIASSPILLLMLQHTLMISIPPLCPDYVFQDFTILLG